MLARLREEAGLTQDEAARRLGVHSQTISRWERGERRIKAVDLSRAVELYKATTAGLGHSVPRGTRSLSGVGVHGELPRWWTELVDRLDRELVRHGATDAEADFVSAALLTPEAYYLASRDDDGVQLSGEARERRTEDFVMSMVQWTIATAARRTAPTGKESAPTRGARVAGEKPPRTARHASGDS